MRAAWDRLRALECIGYLELATLAVLWLLPAAGGRVSPVFAARLILVVIDGAVLCLLNRDLQAKLIGAGALILAFVFQFTTNLGAYAGLYLMDSEAWLYENLAIMTAAALLTGAASLFRREEQ